MCKKNNWNLHSKTAEHHIFLELPSTITVASRIYNYIGAEIGREFLEINVGECCLAAWEGPPGVVAFEAGV